MVPTVEEVAAVIDHTVLRPDLPWVQLESILEEVKRYPFAAVIVPPWYVRRVASAMADSPVAVGTVSGFPLGFHTREVKLKEVERAFEDGAVEVDVMMNLCAFKSGNYRYVAGEIREVVDIAGGRTVKVIIETAYLTREEKVLACELVADGGATFVKTSTGLGPCGARVEDVKTLKEVSRRRVKVKASGGIRSLDDLIYRVEAGADRIGTSSGLSIVREVERNGCKG